MSFISLPELDEKIEKKEMIRNQIEDGYYEAQRGSIRTYKYFHEQKEKFKLIIDWVVQDKTFSQFVPAGIYPTFQTKDQLTGKTSVVPSSPLYLMLKADAKVYQRFLDAVKTDPAKYKDVEELSVLLQQVFPLKARINIEKITTKKGETFSTVQKFKEWLA